MIRLTSIHLVCFVAVLLCQDAVADSAIDLISGFDEQRIESAYPPGDDATTGELAKLMYRMQTVDLSVLKKRCATETINSVGDAIRFSGRVTSADSIDVPAKLVEFLELEKLHLLTVSSEGMKRVVVVHNINLKLQVGDRIDGIGVVVELDPSKPVAIAAANMRWFPKEVPNVGWRLLRDAGVDVGQLAELPSRSKRRLVAADGDAFYSMLAAADSLSDRDDIVAPLPLKPISLLQRPDQLSGQWVQTELETVQITQVFVTNQDRQAQIGSDHYYQIDAVGDLENVIVKIEPTGSADQPVLFEGRYPVSLVTVRLPEFLQSQVAAKSGDDVVGTQLRTKIGVRAFFFRLWSYETDFMKQNQGGSQFGPLLIATSLTDREPLPSSDVGLGMIGYIAAIAVMVGVFGTVLWQRRTSAEDRAIRKNRQARESDRIDFPSRSS